MLVERLVPEVSNVKGYMYHQKNASYPARRSLQSIPEPSVPVKLGYSCLVSTNGFEVLHRVPEVVRQMLQENMNMQEGKLAMAEDKVPRLRKCAEGHKAA